MNAASLRLRAILSMALLGCLAADSAAMAQATKATPPVAAKDKAKMAKEVDLNSATVEELETLPGIGPAYSRKIIDGRPHKAVADLAAAGVPAKTIDGLKGLAVVRPMPTPVEINIDPIERLETLPGVGPAMAKEIAAGRPYSNYEDVAKLKGIGPAKLDALKGRLKFAKGEAPAAKAREKTKKDEMPKAKGPEAKAAVGLVDINTASQVELETLPGIGPVLSKAIIDARPFATIEDIMKVKGIKEGHFAKIKDNITVK